MSTSGNSRIIVGFVADLMFASKIEPAAQQLGYEMRWVEAAGEIGDGAALIERLADWQPALMIFDLSNVQVPWRDWIREISTSPATRRIPVICYGSHVDVQAIKAARAAGARVVLARSQFVEKLPELIRKHARQYDQAGLQAACTDPLLPKALKGLELFNEGDFFEAHEFLEEAWNEDPGPGRELYRAVLQVAVAYLQIERGNYAGALKMFLRLKQWLDPLPDHCRGVDVAQLRADAAAVRSAMQALGPEGVERFDRSLLKPVHYTIDSR